MIMKKRNRFLALTLSFVLLISTISIGIVNASTTETQYSVKHLQNGSFEDNIENYKFSNTYTQPDKSVVPYWDTTAYGGKFEFFETNGKYHFDVTKKKYPNNPEYTLVSDGDIAAELNADEESSIYQRINTVSGSTYTWGLDHRGRDRTDRMVLIIGPEQPVDPSKNAKAGQDQFIRITKWLKTQYAVDYPEIGCSKKYTVFSKPFAANGKFLNESADEDLNISLVETGEINQEWSLWVISSPYCNTASENTVNGWSRYGTNATDNFEDIMKGANSSLGYDCTYTVPKGQTNTLFAFCSYSSGRETRDDPTYGNLLDGINFDLYQPMSASSTAGGIGSINADNADLSQVVIKSDITSGDALNSVVLDGQYCTVYTAVHNDDKLKDCVLAGAYITINNDDGTSVTKFVKPYSGDLSSLTEEEIEELSKSYFIRKDITDSESGREWQYYYKFQVNSPISITMIYTKAPFVLYDSNGGQEYYFSPDNVDGGNLVGFGDHFQKVFLRENELGEPVYLDTSAYYYNYTSDFDENESIIPESVVPGKYISHAALPNANWETNDDGTSPHKFCGWSVIGDDGKQVILDGEHTITYNPNDGSGGIISFTDSTNTIDDMQLDASHGVTLTALWKFVHRAQTQTYNEDTGVFENSAVGGTVEETLIPDDLRASDIKEYYENVDGVDRVECIDAAGNVGDKIMFKAKPDYDNQYMFLGWYYREKQENGTYKEVLRSTSTSIAVTVEEGKLNTYYARFQKITAPVVFYYSPTGSTADYAYYEADSTNTYGKYFQNVTVGKKAVKPTGDAMSVTNWYTSPTERGAEFVFNFNEDRIYDVTELYAAPAHGYNYYNYFRFKEPWSISVFGTLKYNGKYIDLMNDADITDYNVYILKGKVGDTAPTPTQIKTNPNTVRAGKTVNSANILRHSITGTGQSFNRIGTRYSDFGIFNMKAPVWVVFDYTYKGIRYTSTVKDRCLYNDINVYLNDNNKIYTTYPPADEEQHRNLQTVLLNKITGMYDAVASLDITEATAYRSGVSVADMNYDGANDGVYTFSSSTAIRNIEPWGFKYTFSVDGQTVTDFADYGAVVLTDRDSEIDKASVSVSDLLGNENALLFSKSNGNIYMNETNDAVEVYYTDNIYAVDFDKNTYAVFFVKDAEGNIYYSDIVCNSYNSIASADESENAAISQSILDYATALKDYTDFVDGQQVLG